MFFWKFILVAWLPAVTIICGCSNAALSAPSDKLCADIEDEDAVMVPRGASPSMYDRQEGYVALNVQTCFFLNDPCSVFLPCFFPHLERYRGVDHPRPAYAAASEVSQCVGCTLATFPPMCHGLSIAVSEVWCSLRTCARENLQ